MMSHQTVIHELRSKSIRDDLFDDLMTRVSLLLLMADQIEIKAL